MCPATDPTPTTLAKAAVGLLRAAHAEPSLVVTAVTVGLGIGVGLATPQLVVLGTAALAGQLSVGWSNDAVDAQRGLDSGRTDKPLTTGVVSPTAVRRAAGVALLIAVIASILLGPVPGALHLGAVALAWAYNLWLKATPASILAYAVSFAAMPMVVTTTAGAGLPRPWAIVAASCFGAGVHLSNALPDLATDRAEGIRGLPQRLGEQGAAAGAVGLLAVGTGAALVGPFGRPTDLPVAAIVGLVVAGMLLAASLAAARRGRFEMAYQLTVVVGLLVVGGLVAAGGRLV